MRVEHETGRHGWSRLESTRFIDFILALKSLSSEAEQLLAAFIFSHYDLIPWYWKETASPKPISPLMSNFRSGGKLKLRKLTNKDSVSPLCCMSPTPASEPNCGGAASLINDQPHRLHVQLRLISRCRVPFNICWLWIIGPLFDRRAPYGLAVNTHRRWGDANKCN